MEGIARIRSRAADGRPTGMNRHAAAAARSSDYRVDIDGLRAIAILSVILYHFKTPGFAGGFVGVDVFFVISGFLIGGHVAGGLAANRFSLLGFYARRIRRIFPALFCTLALTLLAASVVMFPPDLVRQVPIAAWVPVFAANLPIAKTLGGYSGSFAQASPLLHLWSLAVEEQFYLLFPLAMLAIARLGSNRNIPVLAALAALSFTASVVLARIEPVGSFYLLPGRVWELLLGALLAIAAAQPPRSKRVRDTLALLGLVLIGCAILAFDEATPFPSEFALAPCGGAALILYARCDRRSLAGRLLVNPVFRQIGLRSYSLYLVHWPLLAFTRYYLDAPLSTGMLCLVLAASIGLAALSWRFVEQPFRRPAPSFPIAWGVVAATAAVLLTGAARILPHAYTGSERNFPGPTAMQLACRDLSPDAAIGQPSCRIGASTAGPPQAVLWGDSHALALMPAAAAAFAAHDSSAMVFASAGCPPLLGVEFNRPPPRLGLPELDAALPRRQTHCAPRNDAVLHWIGEQKIPAVILAAHWMVYAATQSVATAAGSQLTLIDVGQPDQTDEATTFERSLAATLDALQRLHVRVFVVEDAPEQAFNVPYALAAQARLGHPAPLGVDSDAYAAQQAVATEIFGRLQRRYSFTRLRPQDILCVSGRCAITLAGQVLYQDGEHLAPPGALAVVPAFAPLWQTGGGP